MGEVQENMLKAVGSSLISLTHRLEAYATSQNERTVGIRGYQPFFVVFGDSGLSGFCSQLGETDSVLRRL
jgi:hypothetical protein